MILQCLDVLSIRLELLFCSGVQYYLLSLPLSLLCPKFRFVAGSETTLYVGGLQFPSPLVLPLFAVPVFTNPIFSH